MMILPRQSPLAWIFPAALARGPGLEPGRGPAPSAAKTVAMDAPSIGRKTAYNILLPADYETSGEKRYPVLYLLHGLTGNYPNWAGMGVGKAAAGLDLIVVMPDGGNSWYVNWAQSDEGQKNAWDDFITEDLIRHVDANYRTIAAREGRAINGLSMGGFGGLTLGLRHPDLYCSIGSHSGALAFARSPATVPLGPGAARAEEPALGHPKPPDRDRGVPLAGRADPEGQDVRSRPRMPTPPTHSSSCLAVPKEKLPHIYVYCGTEDRLIAASRDFAKLLMEHDIPFVYGESAGGHNGQYWSREIGTSVAVQYAILRRSLAKAPSPPKE